MYRSPGMIVWSKHSRRTLPRKRSLVASGRRALDVALSGPIYRRRESVTQA